MTKPVLVESGLVAVLGLAFALLANCLSPRGLALNKDYFPRPILPPVPPATNQVSLPGGTNTNALSAFNVTAARLKEKGLQVVDGTQALQLFRDPRREQELIVFLDARDEQHYQEGHIPGAYLFDHYHAETHIPVVLPVCTSAQQIVVYCNGGNCEDSEFAALTLRRDAGVPGEKLFVYPGGMAEWSTNKWPIEIGTRNSGTLRGGGP